MTFDWSSYLDLAKDLADRDDEASRRSAIRPLKHRETAR